MNFRNWIIRVTLSGLAILIATKILGGVQVDDYRVAWVIAILLSVLNSLVRPILVLLTLPITILTLGIFLLFINGFIILLIDDILDGFTVDSIGWAIAFSILISLFTYLLESFLGTREKNDGRNG
jgi:putative membrane protein